MKLTVLVPVRFLLIISHLLLLITMMQSRDENVRAGLPLDYNIQEYQKRDSQFLGGLIAGIVLTCLELFGFFSGMSMFATLESLLSILCHSSATVSLRRLVLDGWDSQLYWFIFIICSVIPTILEVRITFSILVLKKFFQ